MISHDTEDRMLKWLDSATMLVWVGLLIYFGVRFRHAYYAKDIVEMLNSGISYLAFLVIALHESRSK